MALNSNRYEPIYPGFEFDELDPNHLPLCEPRQPETTAANRLLPQRTSFKVTDPLKANRKSFYGFLKYVWTLRIGRRDWRYGLWAGFYGSLAVLASNIALLLYGALTHDGIVDGISTVAQGDTVFVSRMSTAYHVLINVLSTILLTSSNYAMQILCAPTRNELDIAHRSGQWLEIGLVSFRNLRHIDKRRAMLWSLLAASSVPLHLLSV